MANIIARHDFLDPKDQLHQLMSAKDFLDLSGLFSYLRCAIDFDPEQPEPPPGFVPVGGTEEDIRTVTDSGLAVYSSASFFEVPSKPAPSGFIADWWREIRYVDESRTRLVCFPNDRSDQPRLMVYGPGPTIKGEATLSSVSFELRPAPRGSGLNWLGVGPYFYPVSCNPKDASNACVNESCPEGSTCTVVNIEDRDTHCSSVCACLTEN